MKNLIITGVLSQPFGSWPVVSQSDDGIIWDEPVTPWIENQAPTAIATDGTIVAVTNTIGKCAYSTDLVSFSWTKISDGLNVSSLVYANGFWIAAGQKYYASPYGPYEANNDLAQIHRSTSPSGPWLMTWVHPNVNSFIYQCKYFANAAISSSLTANVLVAVGSVGNIGNAWYSLDSGASWTEITVPAGVGRILSVDFASVGANSTWYWGTKGYLYKSSSLNDTTWESANIDESATITDIRHNEVHLLFAGTSVLQTSENGIVFDKLEKSGYVFDRVISIPDNGSSTYIAFLRSNLTQYSFLVSNDAKNWTPYNNNISVSGCTLNI